MTRSTVQKALVVITDEPQHFGQLRERLSIVTSAWFAQKSSSLIHWWYHSWQWTRDFSDIDILRVGTAVMIDPMDKRTNWSTAFSREPCEKSFLRWWWQRPVSGYDCDDSVADIMRLILTRSFLTRNDSWIQTSDLSIVQMLSSSTQGLFAFSYDGPSLTCLQMLFFGSRCERLCMIQFCLISLIPGLIQNLQDCADPALESYAQNIQKPTSLRTSDRSSCKDLPVKFKWRLIGLVLAYMGLPLQLFGKVSISQYWFLLSSWLVVGQLLWPIHSSSAAGSACRLRYQVIHCWINQFLTTSTTW